MKGQGSVVRYLRAASAARKAQDIDVARAPLRAIIAVIVMAILLEFAEREMSGARAGSFLSVLAPYVASIMGARPG